MIKIFLLSVTVLILSGCFSKSDETIIKESINAEYERLNSNDLERIFTMWAPEENKFTFAKYIVCLESMNLNVKSVLNDISNEDYEYIDKYEPTIERKIYREKDYKTILANTEKEFRDKDKLKNSDSYFILFGGNVKHINDAGEYKEAVLNNLIVKLSTSFAKKHEEESRFCIQQIFDYKKPTDIAVKISKNKKQAVVMVTYEDGSTKKKLFQKNEKGEWEQVLMMFSEE